MDMMWDSNAKAEISVFYIILGAGQCRCGKCRLTWQFGAYLTAI